MKGILLGKQCFFWQYICFHMMDFPETTLGALPTNGVILVAIGQYLGFHSRGVSQSPQIPFYTHCLQKNSVWLQSANKELQFTNWILWPLCSVLSFPSWHFYNISHLPLYEVFLQTMWIWWWWASKKGRFTWIKRKLHGSISFPLQEFSWHSTTSTVCALFTSSAIFCDQSVKTENLFVE
jgi:hypothetical protein